MNSITKQSILVFSVLLIESILFTSFLLATDKGINGIANAFSLKYLFDFILWGALLFFAPLTLAYMFLKNNGFKPFFITLVIVGFCIAGVLSLLQLDAGGYNHLLYFIYRGVVIVGVFAFAILTPWTISKFMFVNRVHI